MHLVIIEAIGKLDTVRRAAQQRWGKDTAVFATGGYIWTFPNDRIGIDPHTLVPTADLKTTNGKIFESKVGAFLEAQGSVLDKVILLTDPDREGEGIAKQAQQIVLHYAPDATFQRVYAHELNIEGLKRAVTEPEIHGGVLAAHTARRVLDRLLPLSLAHQLHRDGDFVGMGRLQTAAIRVVKDKSLSWKKYVLTGLWKTPEGDFFVREYDDSKVKLEAKLHALMSPNAYASAPKKDSTITIEPPPAHSGQSLLATMLSLRPDKTMEAMQASYMQGRMSYPRTDQTMLGAYAKRGVAAITQNLHMGHRLSATWYKETTDLTPDAWIQGAHPALHPTLAWTPASSKPTTVQERVEHEVAARAIASLMTDAVIQRKVVSLTTDDGVWFEVVKDTIVDSGWTLAYERLGLSNPLLPSPQLGKKLPLIKEQLPTQAHIIEWLNDEHLGRPATLASLPTKLQSLGLVSVACVPTRYADMQLREIERVMPAYTYASFSDIMEKGLSRLVSNPEDYLDVVKSILIQAGTDVITLPVAIERAKPVEFDDENLGLSDFAL